MAWLNKSLASNGNSGEKMQNIDVYHDWSESLKVLVKGYTLGAS